MYSDALRKKLVKDFIVANRRAPTTEELQVMVREAEVAYPKLDEVGFVGYNSYKVHIQDVSSAALENQRRDALELDMTTTVDRIEQLKEQITHTFGSLNGTSQRLLRSLYGVESRMNNLILASSKADAFLHGIEETLTVQDKIVHEDTTAEITGGYAILPRANRASIDLNSVKITTDFLTSGRVLGKNVSGTIDSLKRVDGSIWVAVVTTDQALGRVTLVVEVDFGDIQNLTSLRLTTKIPDTNNRAVCTVQYGVEGAGWTAILPVEQQLFHGENEISLGVEARKIRLLLSKDAADLTTITTRQHQYCFQIDAMEFFEDGWDAKEAVVTCGPYVVEGYDGDPIQFTKATLNWCGVEPAGTKVSWFLSQDRTTWYAADPGALVSFWRGDMTDTYDLLIPSSDVGAVVAAPVIGLSIADDEALLNLYIPAAELEYLNRRSIMVRRNTPDATIYRAFPGWTFDSQNNQYSCWMDVKNPAGQLLRLGNRFATVDGQSIGGDVLLSFGFHRFQTADQNVKTVTSGLTTEDALREADPLYPYNHRYLIEGYVYPDGFAGERIYPGVGDWFGRNLSYVAPEQLATMDQYTLEEVDGSLYVIVKVDRRDASWSAEIFDVQYTVQGRSTDEGGANALFVKAILATEDTNLTPKIDSFTVRVL